MTLKEKVGQMAQVSIDVISVGKPFQLEKPHKLDPVKLKKAIVEYGVGSILNVGGYTYSREHWYKIHKEIQDEAKKSRLKVPILYGIDAIHGVNYTVGGTLFPQPLAMAATWDPQLVEEGASITAYECRASGIPWNFSPVLDVMRNPLWSRVFETYGEDVHLAQVMGEAMIRGYEGDNIASKDKVASCMKHFLGYSFPFSGKDRTPTYIGDVQLREYFLPTFQTAIDQGAHTIMINSGEINGIPVHANHDILTKLLRDEMGFEGIALTDWEDIKKLHEIHKVASSYKEAIKIAINAGIDMSMTPMDLEFIDLLVELVNEGEVSEDRINEAVRRILTLKFDLGLFDQPYFPMEDYPKFGSEEFAEASYQSALAGITLLKNEEQTLPLATNTKVLLTGAASHSLNIQNGAWTHVWQGTDPQYNTKGKLTLHDALAKHLGDKNLQFVQGTTVDEAVDIEEAVKAAKNVESIIIALGENPSTEKPGDIDDLTISAPQIELVKALAKTEKPITFVLMTNRPLIIREIEPYADAILMTYHPGDEGGRAAADILLGKHNPEGKLPFTYPRYVNTLLTYDHKQTEKLDTSFGLNAFNPQFEFGYGLSYTQFEYGEISLSAETLNPEGSITASIKVTNTGDREGREVVQLYSKDLFASITPCTKRLRAFAKVSLKAGESTEVRFKINPEDLAFVNKNLEKVTEAGDFEILVADKKATFTYIEK